MKVAITGHTSGIGLSLYNKFIENNIEIIGFSKSTGYDIGSKPSRQHILEQSKDFDVFINNAYHSTGQKDLLTEMLESWQNTNKSIINISSNIKSLPESFFGIKEIKCYRDSKKELDEIVVNYKGTINVLNILPELTRTNFNLGIDGFDISSGMDPDYVATIIYDTFKNVPNKKELIIKHWQWTKHAN
jgi:short-subunit dehydrogenase involved in D-alanine esterification of teichoic acids